MPAKSSQQRLHPYPSGCTARCSSQSGGLHVGGAALGVRLPSPAVVDHPWLALQQRVPLALQIFVPKGVRERPTQAGPPCPPGPEAARETEAGREAFLIAAH